MEGVGGLEDGGILAGAADQHHAHGQALRHAAGHGNGGVTGDVEWVRCWGIISRGSGDVVFPGSVGAGDLGGFEREGRHEEEVDVLESPVVSGL